MTVAAAVAGEVILNEVIGLGTLPKSNVLAGNVIGWPQITQFIALNIGLINYVGGSGGRGGMTEG